MPQKTEDPYFYEIIELYGHPLPRNTNKRGTLSVTTECSVIEMTKSMLKSPRDSLRFGEMCIRKCNTLGHPISIRVSTASRTLKGKSITDPEHIT
jgi:hypothetical protein